METVPEQSQPVENAKAVGSGASGERGEPSRAWLPVGFLLFGTVTGFIAGASSHDGISEVLLTSVVAFVGGAFLTFAGFQVRGGAGGPATASPGRTGLALSALSSGIWVGLAIGIVARLHLDVASPHEPARPRDVEGAVNAATAPPVSLLHGGQTELMQLCDHHRGRLRAGGFASLGEATRTFSDFLDYTCSMP